MAPSKTKFWRSRVFGLALASIVLAFGYPGNNCEENQKEPARESVQLQLQERTAKNDKKQFQQTGIRSQTKHLSVQSDFSSMPVVARTERFQLNGRGTYLLI